MDGWTDSVVLLMNSVTTFVNSIHLSSQQNNVSLLTFCSFIIDATPKDEWNQRGDLYTASTKMFLNSSRVNVYNVFWHRNKSMHCQLTKHSKCAIYYTNSNEFGRSCCFLHINCCHNVCLILVISADCPQRSSWWLTVCCTHKQFCYTFSFSFVTFIKVSVARKQDCKT